MMIAARERHPDDADLVVAIRDMFEAIDPMPSGLPDRIRLALAFRDLEAEMARFSCATDELVLAARGAEESRIVTFDSDSLTIMIRVDANPDGTARVDGWIAPPQAHRVDMKLTASSITVTADGLGRFVFHSVPRGAAQLIVRPPEAGVTDGARSVITPALVLLAASDHIPGAARTSRSPARDEGRQRWPSRGWRTAAARGPNRAWLARGGERR
jgi:hypothetical protein